MAPWAAREPSLTWLLKIDGVRGMETVVNKAGVLICCVSGNTMSLCSSRLVPLQFAPLDERAKVTGKSLAPVSEPLLFDVDECAL